MELRRADGPGAERLEKFVLHPCAALRMFAHVCHQTFAIIEFLPLQPAARHNIFGPNPSDEGSESHHGGHSGAKRRSRRGDGPATGAVRRPGLGIGGLGRAGECGMVCKPDWNRHGKAAPFRRNDELLNLLPKGLIAFPGSGITDNLVDKAVKLGIPVMRAAAVMPSMPGAPLLRWTRASAFLRLPGSTTASMDGLRPSAGLSGSAHATRTSVPRSPVLRASPFASGSKASSNWIFCRLVRMSVPS